MQIVAKWLLLSYCVIVGYAGLAQIPSEAPAQSYTIEAQLKPEENILNVRVRLDYRNASMDTLEEMIIHLWANAFQDKNSSYGRQKRTFGDVSFYFTPQEERIGYNQLVIQQSDKARSWQNWQDHNDVIIVPLEQSLAPGELAQLTFTYELNVPGFHSRLGTDGQIWQFAHWFPKVARLDQEGWHPMPYLELGEFYQDFAHYSVSLQLPDSFTLVGTGIPADSATWGHHQEALVRTSNGIAGLGATPQGTRTWNYEALWVPDMAWAASSAYLMQAQRFSLANGQEVSGQVVYTEPYQSAWKNALKAVVNATQFYDRKVGTYPWPQVTAIQGVKGFPGGMEYPMVTFIQPNATGSMLETVIAHEVGHNWFFGVLSSDERRFAWMDEGLNSYYEHLYTQEHEVHDGMIKSGLDFNDYLLLDLANSRNLPLPSDGVSKLKGEIDYQVNAYSVPSLGMRILAATVGEEKLDLAFQSYYQKWSFRHPMPEDVQHVFETQLQQDLDWYFGDIMEKPYYRDLKLRKVEENGAEVRVHVANKYQKQVPWRLTQWSGDQFVAATWYPGFSQRDTVVSLPFIEGVDRYSVLDSLMPDLRLGNNSLWMSPVFKRYRDWRPGFGMGIRHARQPRTYVLPLVGVNAHDGWQWGLALHNQKVYYQPAGFYLGGLYGVDSERWNWHGAIYHDVYPNGGPGQWRMAFTAASFSYFTDKVEDYTLAYRRWSPSITWQSRMGKVRGQTHWQAGIHAWFIQREHDVLYDPDGSIRGKEVDNDRIFAFRVKRERPDALQPWHVALDVEFQPYENEMGGASSYLKTGLEAVWSYRFREEGRFNTRVYTGYFPHNTQRESYSVSNPASRGSLALAFQGHNDYRFEETFLGRNTTDGSSRQQIYLREGGFKTALGPAFRQGQSNDFICAINLWSHLPWKIPYLPLEVYADIGFWSDRTPTDLGRSFSDQVWIDSGVKLSIFGDRIAVFFPIIQNKNLDRLLNQLDGGYLNRVTWMVRLDHLRLPWRPLSLI